MNIPLAIGLIALVVLIFAGASWAGPKVIRAMYPEEMHERMIKSHRIMVMVAIVVLIIGLSSGLPAFLANT